MDIEIHLDGMWHACATLTALGAGQNPLAPVRLKYELGYAAEHLDARDYRAVSIRAPVDFSARTLPHWPSFLIDLLPQGAALRRIERLAVGALSAWELLEKGAINPVGNLRIAPDQKGRPIKHAGFTLEEMCVRGDAFVDYALELGAVVAGATDTQGDAPKFWVVEDQNGRWHPDNGDLAFSPKRHALLKFPVPESGAKAEQILAHEAVYQRVASWVGLRTTETLPTFNAGALLLPRFDRRVESGREIRLGVESLYSIIGVVDSAATVVRHHTALIALAHCVNDFESEFVEYVRRDLLNLALGNRDNHGRNTAVLKDTDGSLRLAPVYDFGPSFLDARAIVRVIRWDGEEAARNWNQVSEHLDIRFSEAGLPEPGELMRKTLRDFATTLRHLPEVLQEYGFDEAVFQARVPEIERLARELARVTP